ncbi:MAG: cysteine desulfurase [Acidobacteria bacterium]|nr:cysteine desulfurase [Acidobacteriota bacterium]MYD71327.1 cysteine desulfurase [Acidobacteriota bacterium]MYJ04022.1 cysteine desulfurase [Acidobacteriota bacterium]
MSLPETVTAAAPTPVASAEAPASAPAPAPASVPAFDIERIRADFPILRRQIREHALSYLDNAATTQKPRAVLDAIARYYASGNANIHRGVYVLSEEATAAYDAARVTVQRFLNARSPREIVFTRNSTESINLVAQSFGRRQVGPGDEVLITHMEHHSNIVPWQLLCEQVDARLRVVPIDDRGVLQMDEFERLITPRTRMISVVHLSNSLGTINPVGDIVELARRHGVPVLIDASQSVYHMPVDVQALDCDFLCFTGHKTYGPTGIGVLYGRESLLDAMPPYQGGGDMIRSVTFEKTTYAELPNKFEAGTPNIAGVVGLGAALDYLTGVGFEAIAPHEADLLAYGTAALSEVRGLRLIGTAPDKASILAFVMKGAHPHDVGTIVDTEGVAIRTGHHCTQPIMDYFGVPATARASVAMYSTRAEIDALVRALERVREMFPL